MTNFKRHQRGLLAIAAAAMTCLFIQSARANGELTSTTSSSTTTVPADELGTGNFSPFPFKVSFSVRGGYDDNVTTSHVDPQSSAFVGSGVALTYDFGSPRTQLSLQAGAGFTYYLDNPEVIGSTTNQDYDVNGYVGLSLTHKASERLTFNASIYATYQTEPDFTQALGLNRRSGNYFYTQDKFGVTYLWAPRFATTTSYTFGAINYEDGSIGLFEDRFENTFGNEFKFLLSPTTSLVAEYRFGLVNFSHEGDVITPAIPAHLAIIGGVLTVVPATPAGVLERDSQSHYILGGFDHSFNPRTNVSFRGGVQIRDYVDAGPGIDESRTEPYFEGTLNYAVGKDTSIAWTTRYAIEESDTLLNPSRKTFRTGLTANHNITPKWTANVGVYYQHDDYDGATTPSFVSAGFTEQSFDAALTMRYAITRYIGLQAGYAHTEVWSDTVLREYSRNRYWGGINIIF